MRLNKGDKLVKIDKYYGIPVELYSVIRVNKKTYTLNNKDLIDKETLIAKGTWNEKPYLLATQKHIDIFLENQLVRKKRLVLQDFNNEVKEINKTLKFYLENKEHLSLSDNTIENIEYFLEVLKEELDEL